MLLWWPRERISFYGLSDVCPRVCLACGFWDDLSVNNIFASDRIHFRYCEFLDFWWSVGGILAFSFLGLQDVLGVIYYGATCVNHVELLLVACRIGDSVSLPLQRILPCERILILIHSERTLSRRMSTALRWPCPFGTRFGRCCLQSSTWC